MMRMLRMEAGRIEGWSWRCIDGLVCWFGVLVCLRVGGDVVFGMIKDRMQCV